MSKKIRLIILAIVVSFIFTLNVSAYTVEETKLWTKSYDNGGLGLKNVGYNTKKGSGSLSRETQYIGTFKITSGNSKECVEDGEKVGCEGTRWFCVEPGTPLESGNKVTGARITDTAPNPSNDSHWTWDVSGDKNHLEKVLSCWYNNRYSVIATQAIVWEIVSEERNTIQPDVILGGTYKPFLSNGSTFGSGTGITSLYELIANTGSGAGDLSDNDASRKKLYKAYQEVLKCAARFSEKPSKSYQTKSNAVSNPVKLTTYDDATGTFSTTISDSLLNYYKINESKSELGSASVSLKDGKLTVKTKQETTASNLVVALDYAYITKSGVDSNAHKLRDDGEMQYLVKTGDSAVQSNGKYPQAMARGSKSQTYYIAFYTDEKPKYQIKLKKAIDSATGSPMSGISFYICSANSIKSGQSCNNSNKITTITTNSAGEATYSQLSSLGQYVAQEVSTPGGYVADTTPATFNVIASNKAGTNSYAMASKTFVNKIRHLKLLKRTLDENGNEADLPNDTCPKTTCTNQGPVFNITSNGKKLCVTRNAVNSNQYTFAGLRDACQAGEIEDIETCNGSFDIALIPAGTYVVLEKYAPCGMTRPSNTQTVIVQPDVPVNTVTLYNGVTGLVFTKSTEDGTKLDGGKFALQKKNNGIYEDMLLVHVAGAKYEYSQSATTDTQGATYLLDTTDGVINVKGLPKGEYRMVEKQAPEGYDLIKEKDSTAKVTISDKATATDFYQIKMVNKKTTVQGSSDQAEVVVTIKTGRNVINYPIVIGIVVLVLVGAIIIRKKMKK